MTAPHPDADLHAAFQAQRAAERRGMPSYALVTAGRPEGRRPARRVRWLLLSGALASVFAGVWVARQARTAHELELARSMMELESPTASLLPAPSPLISFIPRIGISVPESPLRALDPGGPLGPPLTRSPRL